MAETFAQTKLQWLDALNDDREVPHFAARLASRLALKHADREDGCCHPGKAYLAEQFGVDVSTIERALRALRKRGWIAVEARPGPGAKLHIRLLIDNLCDGDKVVKMPSKVTGIHKRSRHFCRKDPCNSAPQELSEKNPNAHTCAREAEPKHRRIFTPLPMCEGWDGFAEWAEWCEEELGKPMRDVFASKLLYGKRRYTVPAQAPPASPLGLKSTFEFIEQFGLEAEARRKARDQAVAGGVRSHEPGGAA